MKQLAFKVTQSLLKKHCAVKSRLENIRKNLRGGFITKYKGEVASCAPENGFATRAITAVTIVAGAAFLPAHVNAQQAWDPDAALGIQGGTGSWDAGSTNWTTDGGFTNTVYNATSPSPAANFGGLGGTVTVNGGQAITDLNFQVTGYTIQGDQLAINDIGSTITIGGGNVVTINNTLSNLGPGTGSVTVSGGGTVIFGGPNAYTGDTIISAGTLQLRSNNVIANASDLVINGGTLDLNGRSEVVNNISGTGGTIDSGGGSASLRVNQSTDATYAGNFIGATSILSTFFTKNGTGTLTLTGTNTQTGSGAFNVGGGTLQVQNGNAIGDNQRINGDAGATFELLNNETIGDLSGLLDVALGSNTLTLDGTIGINFGLHLGDISGTGSLVIDLGDDFQQLSGNNTFTGGTTIDSGELRLRNGSALADAGAVTVNGGTLDVDAAETIGSLSLTAGGAFVDAVGGALTITDSFILSNGAVVAGSTINTPFFGQTGGMNNGTVNALYTVTADGGTIPNLSAAGINATNTTANGISVVGSAGAPVLNNTTGNGIGLNNSGGGNVLVTLANNVQGSGDGINIVNTGGGTVSVNGAGNVTGGTNVGDDGIQISNDGGGTTVSVNGTITGDPGIIVLDNAGGNITVNGIGNVTGSMAEGIFASSVNGDGVVLIAQDGIVTGATTGIDARSSNAGAGAGAVTVTAVQNVIGQANTGVITRTDTGLNTVNGASNIQGATFGIDAQTSGGTILISGSGATSSSANDSTVINAFVNAGNGDITVTRSGDITNTGSGVTNGIVASSASSGKIDVTSGAITLSDTSRGTGILATSTGGGSSNFVNGADVIVSNGGAINGGAIGISASSVNKGSPTDATVTVSTGADIGGTDSVSTAGIFTNTVDGQNRVDVAHNITSDGIGVDGNSGGSFGFLDINQTAGIISAGTIGIDADNNGSISMQILIDVTGGTINAGTQAITATMDSFTSPSGVFILVDNATIGDTSGNVIEAENRGTGGISIISNSDLTSTAATAVVAEATSTAFVLGAGGTVTVNGNGNFNGVIGGIDASSSLGGNVVISGSGNTNSSGANSTTINARAITNGEGDVTVDRSGAINNTGSGTTRGINATALNGAVNVVTGAQLNIAGVGSIAINAANNGTTGDSVVVNSSAGAITSTGTAASNGIIAFNASSGAIDVDSGAITLANASTGTSIDASSTGGSNVRVDNVGAINGGGVGINAATTGAGTVNVTLGADVGTIDTVSQTGISNTTVDGANVVNIGHSINSDALGLDGNVSGTGLLDINQTAGTITSGTIGIDTDHTGTGSTDIDITGGSINALVQAITADVVAAGAGTLNIDITNGATIGATTGNTIDTGAGGGATTINVNSNITSTGADGIEANSTSGDINIDVMAASTVLGTPNAITTTSNIGAMTILNNGIIGQAGGAARGLVQVTGTNIAGSTFTNNGTWFAHGGNSNIQGNVVNTGLINLNDGNATDNIMVSGDFMQSATGRLTVDVDATGGNADRITVTGAANVAGTVDINLITGSPVSQTTILTATGGVTNTATVGTVTGANNPLATVQLLATANDLLVDISINNGTQNQDGTISNVFNSNQNSIVNSLNNDSSPEAFGAVIGLASIDETQSALDQLGGEVFLHEETATLTTSHRFTEQLFSCQLGGEGYTAISEGACIWLRPQGRYFEVDRNAANTGFDETAFGISLGGQSQIEENWFAGFAIGFEEASISTDVGGDSDRTTYHGGLSLKHVVGDFALSAAVTGGVSNFDTTRNISIGNFTATNTSDHDVSYLATRLRAAHLWEIGDHYIKPLVDLDFIYLDRDGFTESGTASTALSVSGGNESIFSASPAIEFGMEQAISESEIIRAYGKVGGTFYSDTDRTVNASFAATQGAAPTFTNTTDFDEAFLDIEAGLTFIDDENASLQLGYQGSFSENTSEHGAFAKINLKF